MIATSRGTSNNTDSPVSSVTLKSSNQLEEHSRKGVSQVQEWREWIQNNLDYARRRRRQNGLGLTDIRHGSQGLVLVGRRSRLLDNTELVRSPIREENNIMVHTYDWLLSRLDGVLRYSGPSALNDNVIPRDRDDGDARSAELRKILYDD